MKKKISHIFKSATILISYTLCLVIGILYTLYVDGSSGVLLVSFVVLIPIMSIIFMIIASKSIDIQLKVSTDTVKKNSQIGVTIQLSKKNVIPIPFINLTLGYSPHLEVLTSTEYSIESFPQIRFSMAFEKSLQYEYKFNTKVSGKGSIYIDNAYIYDYLGFFRIKLKEVKSIANVYIPPEVKEIQSSQVLFNSICNNIITNDEEETSNDNSISIGSTLGYLHRDYVMGDSPRRINWKLSCKKSKLMVRLDEPSPQSKPCFLIDMSINKDNPNHLENIINFEKLIESSLALLNMCVTYGIECECILFNCKQDIKRVISSIDDIYSLAVAISHNDEDGKHQLPKEVSNLKSSDNIYILFTDFYFDDLQSEINQLKKKNIHINVILSPQYLGTISSQDVWIVKKDLSIASSGI